MGSTVTALVALASFGGAAVSQFFVATTGVVKRKLSGAELGQIGQKACFTTAERQAMPRWRVQKPGNPPWIWDIASMDVWISETLSMLSLDITKIHGSEVSMRCCTSSGLCFSRWAWVEHWKSCGIYGYEMLWNAINPPCFVGYLRGILDVVVSFQHHIYHISIGTLGGSIPHPPKKGLSSSGFFLPTVWNTACWINVRVVEKVRTCLEGRSTFIEPVQRKRLGGKKNPNQTRWYESYVYYQM